MNMHKLLATLGLAGVLVCSSCGSDQSSYSFNFNKTTNHQRNKTIEYVSSISVRRESRGEQDNTLLIDAITKKNGNIVDAFYNTCAVFPYDGQNDSSSINMTWFLSMTGLLDSEREKDYRAPDSIDEVVLKLKRGHDKDESFLQQVSIPITPDMVPLYKDDWRREEISYQLRAQELSRKTGISSGRY